MAEAVAPDEPTTFIQKISDAALRNFAHKAASIKTSLIDSCGPFCTLIDQYATLCNDLFALFANAFLLLYDAINNLGSPVEICTNVCLFLVTLVITVCHFLLAEIFYLIALPVTVILDMLLEDIFLLFLSVFLPITLTAFILIIKYLSIVVLYRAVVRTIVLPCWRLFQALGMVLRLCLYVIVDILCITVIPVKFLFRILFRTFADITRYFKFPKRQVSQVFNSSSESNDRVLCCVCFAREKSTLFLPCSHICLCSSCTAELLMINDDPVCPLCRTPISGHIDVYI